MNLIVDPARFRGVMLTGMTVRASYGGIVDSYDIAELDTASLITWLRSRGGRNAFAEGVVCMLLGHDAEISAREARRETAS